jgi:hypothetical protein
MVKLGNVLNTRAVRARCTTDLFLKIFGAFFYSKGLVDFFHLQCQIYCYTGDTVKHIQRLNNIFKLILQLLLNEQHFWHTLLSF